MKNGIKRPQINKPMKTNVKTNMIQKNVFANFLKEVFCKHIVTKYPIRKNGIMIQNRITFSSPYVKLFPIA